MQPARQLSHRGCSTSKPQIAAATPRGRRGLRACHATAKEAPRISDDHFAPPLRSDHSASPASDQADAATGIADAWANHYGPQPGAHDAVSFAAEAYPAYAEEQVSPMYGAWEGAQTEQHAVKQYAQNTYVYEQEYTEAASTGGSEEAAGQYDEQQAWQLGHEGYATDQQHAAHGDAYAAYGAYADGAAYAQPTDGQQVWDTVHEDMHAQQYEQQHAEATPEYAQEAGADAQAVGGVDAEAAAQWEPEDVQQAWGADTCGAQAGYAQDEWATEVAAPAPVPQPEQPHTTASAPTAEVWETTEAYVPAERAQHVPAYAAQPARAERRAPQGRRVARDGGAAAAATAAQLALGADADLLRPRHPIELRKCLEAAPGEWTGRRALALLRAYTTARFYAHLATLVDYLAESHRDALLKGAMAAPRDVMPLLDAWSRDATSAPAAVRLAATMIRDGRAGMRTAHHALRACAAIGDVEELHGILEVMCAKGLVFDEAVQAWRVQTYGKVRTVCCHARVLCGRRLAAARTRRDVSAA